LFFSDESTWFGEPIEQEYNINWITDHCKPKSLEFGITVSKQEKKRKVKPLPKITTSYIQHYNLSDINLWKTISFSRATFGKFEINSGDVGKYCYIMLCKIINL
jgi:hypothetical protein